MPRSDASRRSAPKALSDRTARERLHENEVLSGRVRLDHASFQGCAFRRATLIYAGLGPMSLNGCTFEDTTFEFDGPAANAMALLQAMAQPSSGLSHIVKASFPRLFGH